MTNPGSRLLLRILYVKVNLNWPSRVTAEWALLAIAILGTTSNSNFGCAEKHGIPHQSMEPRSQATPVAIWEPAAHYITTYRAAAISICKQEQH